MKPIALVFSLLVALAAWMMWGGASSNPETKSMPSTLQCPMHPWVKSDHAARCAVCGMELASTAMCGAMPGMRSGAPVMLPVGSVQIAGIKTSEVKKQKLVRTLRVSGMIGEDDSRHGIVSAPVEGRIDGLSMNHEGQTITQRQPIATIFSRTLLAAAKDYKAALPQGGESLDKARRTLEQYGLVWEQIKTIPDRQPDDLYFGILSPRTGVIVKSYVSEGQYVRQGDKLFETADFTTMWFHCMVPEQDAPLLKQGQIVKLHTATLPGVTLTSRVYSISPNLDDMQRAAKVRVVLENPDRRLRNNAFAEGVVEMEADEVLTIPRSAVLWPGDAPRVYVAKEAGVYEPRVVKLGRAGDALWEVLDGMKGSEQVVINGAMLIDSQAQLNSAAP